MSQQVTCDDAAIGDPQPAFHHLPKHALSSTSWLTGQTILRQAISSIGNVRLVSPKRGLQSLKVQKTYTSSIVLKPKTPGSCIVYQVPRSSRKKQLLMLGRQRKRYKAAAKQLVLLSATTGEHLSTAVYRYYACLG